VTTPRPRAPDVLVSDAPPTDDEVEIAQLLRRTRVPEAGGLARLLGARLVQARLGLAPPPTLGRYEVTRKLGEGGMGAVFLARDPRLERDVAIKVLHPRADDARGQERLTGEALALARLNHEHVVVVHDVGEQDGQVWLAMEHLAGGTLRRWRQTHLDAGWAEVTRHLLAAARGLAAAHRAGVVHRDFKPDNVLLGADGRARVADFGLARPAGDHEVGRVEGTPLYLPPEVAAGEPPSPAGDQYSFFVSFRELLDAPGEAGEGEPLPAALEALLSRGLAAAPSDRWPSLDAVVARLEALLAAPPDPRRDALMARVQRIWLDGVERSALSGTPPVALDLVELPDAIEAPWSSLPSPAAPSRRTTASLRRELWRAHGSLLLLGGPGAGKTTALLGLARELLERARADRSAPVPVVLNLASAAADTGSLATWLVDELVTKYGLPRRRARRWLEDGALVLLLDGLDEVAAPLRRAVVERLNACRSEQPTGMVVACREAAYAGLGVKLRVGAALRIEAPGERALDALCAGHGEVVAGAWRALAEDEGAARPSPLVVSLWLRARGASAPDEQADDPGETEVIGPSPDAAAGLYDAYVGRALERSPRLDEAGKARLVAGLTWLAATLRRVGSADLWLERMQADWLPTRGQRWAARGLGLTLLALIAFGWNAAVSAVAGRRPVVGALMGAIAVVVALILNRGLRIQPREALRWSWRASAKRLPLLVALGVAAGLLLGTVYIAWVNVVLCVFGAVAIAVALGLEPRDEESRIRAAQGLRQSLTTALVVAVGTGLLAGLAVGYGGVSLVLPHVGPESTLPTLPDPRLSLFLSAGGFAGLVAGLVYGGLAVTLHLALRLVIAVRSPLPFRLATWLDRAADRGILRRVGGGWMFLHRTLLDHFLRRPRE